MSLTRRIDVNHALSKRTDDFIHVSNEVIKNSRVINDVNYDLRDLTRDKAIDWLGRTIESSCIVRKNWITLRRILDDIIFNLDWYISRCKMDMKRYREKPDDGEGYGNRQEDAEAS